MSQQKKSLMGMKTKVLFTIGLLGIPQKVRDINIRKPARTRLSDTKIK